MSGAMETKVPEIHLAFRFHVNLYHSYRGDSLDEKGIGKDIRIIRGILDDLDCLDEEGIPVKGTWDLENYYSLELYLPRYAPDIIERIRRRVKEGLDEVEVMSWNNGLLTAHAADELSLAIGWAIRNPWGSGVEQVFGSWAPVARPQECMFSASQIPAYRAAGIEALSLYYSAAPFNGFSSFVPLLAPRLRYNPLSLGDEVSGQSIRILPAANHADLVEHFFSLRSWLKTMRREQLAMEDPVDLILVLDMDADDKFWEGYLPAPLRRLIPSFGGLRSLARSVADLPWLRFALPGTYLRSHGDAGTLSLGQDLADGSFDGYSSWAEKAENARLWTLLARARRTGELAKRAASEPEAGRGASGAASAAATKKGEAWNRAEMDFDASILRSLSTTHFGMASPVMHARRLEDAFARGGEALKAAERLLELAGPDPSSLYFDAGIELLSRGSGAIVRLPDGVADGASADVEALPSAGPWSPSSIEVGGEKLRIGVVNPEASRMDRLLIAGAAPGARMEVAPRSVRTDRLSLEESEGGGLRLSAGGGAVFESPISLPWVNYGGRILGGRTDLGRPGRSAPHSGVPRRNVLRRGAVHGGGVSEAPVVETQELVPGSLAELKVSGKIELGEGKAISWLHVYTLAAGLPSLRVDVWTKYPETEPRSYDRKKAERLDRAWDDRWTETAPFELIPDLGATADRPARVWRRCFDGSVRSYALDYHRFGPDRDRDSLDNHCTDGWVAVAGEGRGLLLAQADSAETIFAFCPMRIRFLGEKQSLRLNPFGSYYGKQWRNPPATTGLGRLAAVAMGDNYDPYAPSWAGQTLRCSLMIAPYEGDRPPEGLQRDALVFARPPWMVGAETVAPPRGESESVRIGPGPAGAGR
jgi:hypothetical protein